MALKKQIKETKAAEVKAAANSAKKKSSVNLN